MKICVIGGTGHIGKFLVPMLVKDGHRVTVVTSGKTPLPSGAEWSSVVMMNQCYGVTVWTDAIRDVHAEVIVDILQGDSSGLYDAVKKTVQHFVVCGSMWMFGAPRSVPTPDEPQGPCPFAGYAQRFEQMRTVQARARTGISSATCARTLRRFRARWGTRPATRRNKPWNAPSGG